MFQAPTSPRTLAPPAKLLPTPPVAGSSSKLDALLRAAHSSPPSARAAHAGAPAPAQHDTASSDDSAAAAAAAPAAATPAPGGATLSRERQEKLLLAPFTYIQQVPGKGVRTLLINAFNSWLKIASDKLEVIDEATRYLHNASLLIDDIQDSSELRRGIPVAHHVYGVAQTINSANYVYFLCAKMVNDLGDPRAATVFTDQLLELHRGQGMDIYWRDAGICPSEAEYRRMVLGKTGALFHLAVRLMQLYSSDDRDYSKLLDLLGLFFQIRDDYANLKSDDYAKNKSFCEDITEGKYSFPIIHSILSTPDDHQVLNILRQRTKDVELKKHCVECIRRSGSFAYTTKVLVELEADARAEIKRLGGNEALTKLIDKLAQIYQHDRTE